MSQSRQYSRRRVTICREGWYYIFVVSFIGGGAILRQVNPLFALAALMIAPLIFNWRISMGMLTRLSIRRKLPARISAGEHLMVDVEVTNDRHRMETYGLCGSERITLVEPRLHEYTAVAEFMIPRVRVKQSASAAYRCILNRRGRYEFGPLRLATRFPIGLVQGSITYRTPDHLIVAPRLGKLTPAWTNLVFRNQLGTQQTISRRGSSEGDFYAIRQWRSGDSKRWIHWRTTARLGNLAVRQYERQSERDLTIVLHLWQSDEPTEAEQDHVEIAASFAATAVSQSFRHAAGRIAIGIAGADNKCFSSMTTKSFLAEVLDQLAVARACSDPDLEQTLVDTCEACSMHSKLVLVTTGAPDLNSIFGERSRRAGLEPEDVISRLIVVDVTQRQSLERLFTLN